MKLYYKYDSGYLNIDSENLYITSSGNWQEARGLSEKNSTSVNANNLRITKMKGFVYTVFGAIASFIIAMVEKNKMVSIGVLVGLAALAYYVLNYFKGEFGKQYKIPLKKIERIEPYANGLRISFLNGENKPDFELIDNVDPVGIKMLTNLKPEVII